MIIVLDAITKGHICKYEEMGLYTPDATHEQYAYMKGTASKALYQEIYTPGPAYPG